jgi:molecular chaperone Hsp33
MPDITLLDLFIMLPDSLNRFIFENTPIRGNTVHLNHTFTAALQHQDCPPVLRAALGELMAAAALLAATLKMQGALVLQIQGNGALKLLVVECSMADTTAEMTLRATAKWSGEIIETGLPDTDFIDMIGGGQFAITLDPKEGGQGYQGIVPLEGSNVAEILQNYMMRSEQIETRIWLACDEHRAAGLLLQKLPETPDNPITMAEDADAWPRACTLAETVNKEELLALPAASLLHLLFSEEDVRLFDAQTVKFHCSCSQGSVGAMLRLLGAEEVESILMERDNIEVHCDFCNARYVFDKVDAELLFSTEIVVPVSKSRH